MSSRNLSPPQSRKKGRQGTVEKVPLRLDDDDEEEDEGLGVSSGGDSSPANGERDQVGIHQVCEHDLELFLKLSQQGDPLPQDLGWVDKDLGCYVCWWAALVGTYCPSRKVENPK